MAEQRPTTMNGVAVHKSGSECTCCGWSIDSSAPVCMMCGSEIKFSFSYQVGSEPIDAMAARFSREHPNLTFGGIVSRRSNRSEDQAVFDITTPWP